MTGNTHRAGGTAFALIAFEVMRSKGWLLPDTNDFIQLAMMYPLVSWGSIFPDLDHGRSSIPDRDPVSLAVNWVLRKMGTKHRSWQTHSILVTGGFCFLIYSMIYLLNSIFGVQGSIGWAYARLATIGFITGVTSHLVLDALTPEGIHIYPGLKMRFVPKSSFFATGGKWEKLVRKVLIVIIVVMIIKITIGTINPTILEQLIDKGIEILTKLRGVRK